LGFLTLPNDVENCYLSSMGYQWVEKEVLIDELNEKYNELEVQEFEGIPTKYYLLFFTTELANQQYKDWEHLMMVVGETNKSKPFGTFITITGIYRYGFAVGNIFNLNDVVGELEDYFKEGLNHIDDARSGNVYYTYLGFVSNFGDLKQTIVSVMEEIN